MIFTLRLLALIGILGLAACTGSRPPWAEGAMVRIERPPGSGSQDLADFAPRLVALHNRERAAAGAPPLAWDAELASAAESYGPTLARRGRLVHSPLESRPGQGENLWMGTAGAYSLDEMVGSWAAEKQLFMPGVFPEVSRSGHWSDVAHYTQIIWPQTARVGCAFHPSRRWDYLVCRYSPGGNVAGGRVP